MPYGENFETIVLPLFLLLVLGSSQLNVMLTWDIIAFLTVDIRFNYLSSLKICFLSLYIWLSNLLKCSLSHLKFRRGKILSVNKYLMRRLKTAICNRKNSLGITQTWVQILIPLLLKPCELGYIVVDLNKYSMSSFSE